MKLPYVIITLTLAAMLLLLAGCGGGKQTPVTAGQATTSASFTFTWPARARLIPLMAESITVSIAGAGGFTTAQTVNRPATGDTSVVNFPVLPDGQLTLTATAYPLADGQGVAQATATVTQLAQHHVPFTVDVTMASTITSVEITPATPIMQRYHTLQLTATAKNAAGQVVLVPATAAFTWSSADTGEATVDSDGLITGRGRGTVTITAIEQESGTVGTIPVKVEAYSIQDLGPGQAWKINNIGQVIGTDDSSPLPTKLPLSWIWTPGQGRNILEERHPIDLYNHNRETDYPIHDINDVGHIVGSTCHPFEFCYPYLMLPGYWRQDLSLMIGSYHDLRSDLINNSGQIAGTFYRLEGSNKFYAYLWTPGGGLQNVEGIPNFITSAVVPRDLNEDGCLVGVYQYSLSLNNSVRHAFLWTSTSGMQDLGILPGGGDSYATSINDNRYVVGSCTFPNNTTHAFLWTPANGMQDLHASLGGAVSSHATSINNAGQIVGNLTDSNGEQQAFLWIPGHGMQYLEKLPGYDPTRATSINNAGQIVGTAGKTPTYGDSDSNSRAVLWTLY